MGFLVENWMMGEGLGLKGIELLVFAHAFSFHRQGKEMFMSEGNLAKMIGCSRKHIGIAYGRLCGKKLLIRSEEKHPGHQTYSYSVCTEEVRRFVSPGCDKRSQRDETKPPTEMGQKVTPTCNLSSHNKEKDKPIHNPMDRDDTIPTTSTTTTRFKGKTTYGTSDQRHAVLTVGHPEDFEEPDRV